MTMTAMKSLSAVTLLDSLREDDGESVATTIDREVKRIIDECYDRAKQIIHEYDDVLHTCAELLLQKEKISRDEFESLFAGRAQKA